VKRSLHNLKEKSQLYQEKFQLPNLQSSYVSCKTDGTNKGPRQSRKERRFTLGNPPSATPERASLRQASILVCARLEGCAGIQLHTTSSLTGTFIWKRISFLRKLTLPPMPAYSVMRVKRVPVRGNTRRSLRSTDKVWRKDPFRLGPDCSLTSNAVVLFNIDKSLHTVSH